MITEKDLIDRGYREAMSDWRKYYITDEFSISLHEGKAKFYCMPLKNELGVATTPEELDKLVQKGYEKLVRYYNIQGRMNLAMSDHYKTFLKEAK